MARTCGGQKSGRGNAAQGKPGPPGVSTGAAVLGPEKTADGGRNCDGFVTAALQ
jgi:hypothetical protein